ncbi:uncharacterized protein DUF742 [Actinomadura pelletieri DSM 43383]|uniref:Uncharacterized protein DUF742 n=1 Tax=Actinomadura pelletieri DSM 43383 TaxID=1120940 RepID=A0A495QKU4_9ACTN|nr:DUF742 domain-containing protein [Actinomadura pelletieri]RKS73051.1 uncharacterized protein DUF742 [Actinomadura pelletieri DSM 43383]
MDTPRERWIGQDAGPVVRPYAVTRGRTRPRGVVIDLVTILVATGRTPGEKVWLSREQRRLLELCRRPSTPADLASEIDLPFRVVQILLEDLYQYGLIEETAPAEQSDRPDPRILMRVLDELRRL